MLQNYVKIAWRNLFRQKVFTLINIAGLSLGLCACMVIYAIVSFELSFESFHPGKAQINRVLCNVTESSGEKLRFAKVPPTFLPEVRNQLTNLEEVAGVIPYNAPITILDSKNVPTHFESKAAGILYPTTVVAEPQYLKIFKYEWLAGDAKNSLDAPFSVVLTANRARQYFGKVELDKIIGRQVVYQDSLKVTVSGIVKDWNSNSDLGFTDIISYSTIGSSFLKKTINQDQWSRNAMSAWVFVKLKNGTNVSETDRQLGALSKLHADATFMFSLELEPIAEMHFNDDIVENQIRTAHKPTLYALMAIALFILILAIINFVNLATAQSMRRNREVSIKKVLGSGKGRLIVQFLTETIIITFLADLIAIALVSPVLKAFHGFIPQGLSFELLNISTISFIFLIAIITSLLAGLYPAMMMAGYKPALELKGATAYNGNRKWFLRKGLIVFQFSVSLVFIIGSLVITSQLKYVREKDPGFKSDAIIIIETPREGHLKTALLAQKLKSIAGISKVAIQWVSPMTDNPRGMKLKLKETDDRDFWITQVAGNENFIPVYNMKILAGRNILKADSVTEFVINETLSKYVGAENPQAAIGKILYWNDQPYPVVGVVADFHTSSFHDPITPICIINRIDRMGSIAIQLASNGKHLSMVQTLLTQAENAWKQVYLASVFSYHFYDETLQLLYEKDRQTSKLINIATGVTIFISCIGLFGLALFIAQKKSKEISIRKTLGASSANILLMLSRDFILLIIIALLIASPVAWYFGNKWLDSFVYRIGIPWWIFLIAGMSAMVISLLTISIQSIKAAITNPVKNLRLLS